MSDEASAPDPPRWRGPVISLGLLVLAFALLAFTGEPLLLATPIVVGGWAVMHVRRNALYWIPLVPCLLALLFWVFVFVTALIGVLAH